MIAMFGCEDVKTGKKFTVVSKELVCLHFQGKWEMGNTEERTFLRHIGKFVPKCLASNPRERYSSQPLP